MDAETPFAELRILHQLRALRQHKFNENHDDQGRFSDGGGGGGSGAGSASDMGKLLAQVAATGGFSYRPGEQTPTSGMVLSLHPEASKVVDANSLTAGDIKSYITANASLLSDKTNYIGAWHDTESGKVFLDVSTIVPDHATATALSQQYGQRAYYNLSTGTEVRVLDEAHAHQVASAPHKDDGKAQGSDLTLHTVSSEATDAQIDALVAAIKKRQADADAAKKKT